MKPYQPLVPLLFLLLILALGSPVSAQVPDQSRYDSIGIVTAMAWQPQGDFLAVGYATGTVCLWDASGGVSQPLNCNQTAHTGVVSSIAWAPLGNNRFASAGADRLVRVWGTSGVDFAQQQELTGFRDEIRDVIWNPNLGRPWLVVADVEKLLVFDMSTNERIDNIPMLDPRELVWSADGTRIGAARDKAIVVIDYEGVRNNTAVKAGTQVGTFSGEGVAIDYHPRRDAVVSLDDDGNVWLFEEVFSGRRPCAEDLPNCPYTRLAQNMTTATSVRISPDGSRIAIAVNGGVNVMQAEAPYHFIAFYPLTDNISTAVDLAWNPTGERLVAADTLGNLEFWLIGNDVPQRVQPSTRFLASSAPGVPITDFAWREDGAQVAVVDDGGTLNIWNVDQPQSPTQTLQEHTSSILSVDWVGNRLLTGSCDPSAILWNADTSIAFAETIALRDCAGAVGISLDGNVLVTGSDDGLVRVWNVFTLQELAQRVLNLPIDDLEWSQAGDAMAVVSDSGRLTIYDMAGFITEERFSRQPNQNLVSRGVAWSPDGLQVAQGSGDRVGGESCSGDSGGCWVAVWDVVSGESEGFGFLNARVLQANSASIIELAWNPSGQWLASLDSNGTLIVWDTATWQRLSLTENLLTADEMVWSPDGLVLAIADGQGILSFYSFTP